MRLPDLAAARHRLLPGPPTRRHAALAAVGVRLAIVLAGLGLVLIPAQHLRLWTGLTSIGVILAVASPAGAGAGLALGAAIINWFVSYGEHGSPSPVATVGFALALYLLHTATALAGAVPLSAELRAPVLARWFRRCLVELGVAAVLVAASYGISRPDSSSVLQLLGLLGVLVLVAVPVLLLHRSRD